MQTPENNPILKKIKKFLSHPSSRLRCRLGEDTLSIMVAPFLTSKNVERGT